MFKFKFKFEEKYSTQWKVDKANDADKQYKKTCPQKPQTKQHGPK